MSTGAGTATTPPATAGDAPAASATPDTALQQANCVAVAAWVAVGEAPTDAGADWGAEAGAVADADGDAGWW